ncbi:DUF523 domain-containing protein [Pseudoalteromonas holothuriae]|uniref:DUF523 domain-containing protein n=1 Tax=Pseudoalteromonas holothuriae TaxID=2963714 RepID=UPI0039659784
MKYAVLAQSSPSCCSSTVYDGHFTGQKVACNGVTTQLLNQHGIQVVGQHNIVDLKALLTHFDV